MTRPISDDSEWARVARDVYPGAFYCGRCGFPPPGGVSSWNFFHSTEYTFTSACFPLCQKCWDLLGCPEARISYYKELIDLWEEQGIEVDEEKKFNIMKAVANGR